MTQRPLTSTDLQTYLTQHHIEGTILHLREDTPTVPDAARVLGVTEAQIIKSLVFLVNRTDPILVIANGTQKVDRRKLATHLGVGQKRVKFASAEQALDITGYIVGSMPPFGHKTSLISYIDPGATTLSTLYGGGGDIHAMLKLTAAELLRATQASVVPVLE